MTTQTKDNTKQSYEEKLKKATAWTCGAFMLVGLLIFLIVVISVSTQDSSSPQSDARANLIDAKVYCEVEIKRRMVRAYEWSSNFNRFPNSIVTVQGHTRVWGDELMVENMFGGKERWHYACVWDPGAQKITVETLAPVVP